MTRRRMWLRDTQTEGRFGKEEIQGMGRGRPCSDQGASRPPGQRRRVAAPAGVGLIQASTDLDVGNSSRSPASSCTGHPCAFGGWGRRREGAGLVKSAFLGTLQLGSESAGHMSQP